MKIHQLLTADRISLDRPLEDKESVLRFAAGAFADSGVVRDAGALLDGMKSREDIMSTGIGGGVGIPHTTSPDAGGAAVLLIRLADPIDFDALDRSPVDIIIAIVVPTNQTVLHLQILAGISRLCKNAAFLRAVRAVQSPEELLEKLRAIEEKMIFH